MKNEVNKLQTQKYDIHKCKKVRRNININVICKFGIYKVCQKGL